MARNSQESVSGDLEFWLDCPECDFEGLVYYKTHPPRYCKDACKQKAYRKRKIRNTGDVTNLLGEWDRVGLSKSKARLLVILDAWGIQAAKEAAALALDVAYQVREERTRH